MTGGTGEAWTLVDLFLVALGLMGLAILAGVVIYIAVFTFGVADILLSEFIRWAQRRWRRKGW